MQDVAGATGLDDRIGAKFLHAGAGYGGSCFSKDTPALIETGQDAAAQVRAYDPESMENAKALLAGPDSAVDACTCAEGADAVAIVTEWDMFRALGWQRIRDRLNPRLLIDLRDIYRPSDISARSFTHIGVG